MNAPSRIYFWNSFQVNTGGGAQCREKHPEVFTREWTKASIEMDCNTYTLAIKMKAEASPVKV